MAKQRRRPSAEAKQQAVRLVTEEGSTLAEPVKRLGINEHPLPA